MVAADDFSPRPTSWNYLIAHGNYHVVDGGSKENSVISTILFKRKDITNKYQDITLSQFI